MLYIKLLSWLNIELNALPLLAILIIPVVDAKLFKTDVTYTPIYARIWNFVMGVCAQTHAEFHDYAIRYKLEFWTKGLSLSLKCFYQNHSWPRSLVTRGMSRGHWEVKQDTYGVRLWSSDQLRYSHGIRRIFGKWFHAEQAIYFWPLN